MLPILHVVFTESGASSLREALMASRRDDTVVCLADNLSFGPIDPADPEVRKMWVEKQLEFMGWPPTPEDDGDNSWEDVSVKARAFWTSRYRRGTENLPGYRAGPRWNTRAFWNGSGSWTAHRAR